MKLNRRKAELLGNVRVFDFHGFVNLQDKSKLVRRSSISPLLLVLLLICAVTTHRLPLHPLGR